MNKLLTKKNKVSSKLKVGYSEQGFEKIKEDTLMALNVKISNDNKLFWKTLKLF